MIVISDYDKIQTVYSARETVAENQSGRYDCREHEHLDISKEEDLP